MVRVTPLWFHQAAHEHHKVFFTAVTWGVYRNHTVLPLGQVLVTKKPGVIEELTVSIAREYASGHPDEYFEVFPSVLLNDEPVGRNGFVTEGTLMRSSLWLRPGFQTVVSSFRAELAANFASIPERPPLEVEVAEVVPAVPNTSMVVATDGSFHSHYGGSSFAWVSDSGEFRSGSLDSGGILRTELYAISDALSTLKGSLSVTSKSTDLVVVTDSQQAVNFLTVQSHFLGLRGNPRMAVAYQLVLDIMKNARLFSSVKYIWQRSHVGHPLNEAADSLARNRRLAVFNQLDEGVLAGIEANIVSDGLAAFSAAVVRG